MLVHSYIYYELNTNIIDDATWSKWAIELRDLQNSHPEESKQVKYYEDFKDWDGSSGAFLNYNRPNIIITANRLLYGFEKPLKRKPAEVKPKMKKLF